MKNLIKKVFKAKGGFTLVELMIIVMIVTILASFALPVFFRYRSQSMQTEAKILLNGLWTSELAHYGEKSEFSMEDSVTNFNQEEEPKFYKNWYIMVYDDGLHFIATCSSNLDDDAFLDVWRITDIDREPVNAFDDVRNIGP